MEAKFSPRIDEQCLSGLITRFMQNQRVCT